MNVSVWRRAGAALLVCLPCIALAAESNSTPRNKQSAQVVDLFAGMKSGDIEVKVVPKDATEGLILVTNKTDKPLTIKLPAAFAGVPVLAQGFGGNGGGFDQGGGGGFGGGNGGGNQGFGGGGMGGGGMGGGGMGGGGGGGFFNVAPEKVAKVKIVTVCLDHGKKDPNPRVPYTLVPIESYAKNAEVTEVIKLMVQGKLDQHSAQAATWHLQNGLTWQELTEKVGAKHLNGSVEPFFTSTHLERAHAAARYAQQEAEKSPAKSAGSESASTKQAAPESAANPVAQN